MYHKKNLKILYLITATALCMSILMGCGKKSYVNPLGPENKEYEKPAITFLSVINGSQFSTDTIPIFWQSNYPEFCEYRYRYQISDTWSTWSPDTLLNNIMADADYDFQVSLRYQNNADTSIASAHFTVTTLSGPSVYLYPYTQTTTALNPTAAYEVRCSGLDTCTAMELIVRGAAISSVALDSSMANSIAFAKDSVINIGINPLDPPIVGTLSFLTITLLPDSAIDSINISLEIPGAKHITDISIDTVAIQSIKGALIIKKD